jgi:uncharacterized cupredoxin-like copper-binding protein/mono/diheme cytochrome c family protein
VTDERTGRELELRREGRAVAPGETPSSVERFYAGDAAHTVGLTEERAAQIVRQSGNARSIAFLATLLVVLFIPLYWFYDVGIPALAGTSRLEQEAEVQQVTDVARGYALYLANCAQCHDNTDQPAGNGLGGVGPPLNDQAKLYNAVTPAGLPGTGHLNPNYLEAVLERGGRYVCGDPKSVMPVWSDENGGPLNYRQIEELIAFLTASKDVTFTYQPEHAEPGQTIPPPVQVSGWRDPAYQPPPGSSPPPDCWRPYSNPAFGGGAGASLAPVDQPGTADSPRVIELVETASLTITDPEGAAVPALAVVAGETVTFRVTNEAGFVHDFYVGEAEALEQDRRADLEGIPDFNEGTEEFTWTVPEDTPTQLQFACTVAGHYASMHGDFQIQSSGG